MPDKFTIQQVAQLVADAPNFTPDEASEWLRLVPLMNDQQLREVTRILQAMASQGNDRHPPAAPTPPPAIARVSTPPPLTAAAKEINEILGIKAPVQPPPQTQLKQDISFAPTASSVPAVEDADTEDTKQKEDKKDVQSKGQLKGVAFHQIQKLEDVSKISLDSLHAWGEEGLLSAFRPLIKEYSWPMVRLEFEQSPLFLAYVDVGRKALGDDGVGSSVEVLQSHEFEAVADLLQKLATAG